jgi:hypothetical protein
MIRLRNLLNEYTDKQKQAMGIPNGAVARGGNWYIGDKYVGQVVDGKFVKAATQTDAPKQLTQPNSTSNIQRRPTVNLDGTGRFEKRSVNLAIKDELGFVEVQPTDSEVAEAQKHGFIIAFDPDVHDAVDYWKQFSIWRTSEARRQNIYDTIDNFIDDSKLKVTTKTPLYRGAHFAKTTMGLARTLLTECSPGNTIKLPPAGFTINAQYAYSFANVPYPELAVMFKLLPKEESISGIHVWDVDAIDEDAPNYEDESEIITRSSDYTITNITTQTFENVSITDSDGNKEVKNSAFLMVELEQNSKVNETVLAEISSNSQKILNFLFADSMKHTAKNLRSIRK